MIIDRPNAPGTTLLLPDPGTLLHRSHVAQERSGGGTGSSKAAAQRTKGGRRAHARSLKKESLAAENLADEVARVARAMEAAADLGQRSAEVMLIRTDECEWHLRAGLNGMEPGWEEDLPGKARCLIEEMRRIIALFPEDSRVRYRFKVVPHSYRRNGTDFTPETAAIRITW